MVASATATQVPQLETQQEGEEVSAVTPGTVKTLTVCHSKDRQELNAASSRSWSTSG